MEQAVYSVMDSKAQEFGPIFLAQNDRIAERTVTESIRGGQSLLSRYPEDFLLFRVGFFDQVTGVIRPADRPVIVIAVKELAKREVADAAAHS